MSESAKVKKHIRGPAYKAVDNLEIIEFVTNFDKESALRPFLILAPVILSPVTPVMTGDILSKIWSKTCHLSHLS